MQNALAGKRVLVTQSTEFMGPVLCEVFAEQAQGLVEGGADLIIIETAQDILEVKAAIAGFRSLFLELGFRKATFGDVAAKALHLFLAVRAGGLDHRNLSIANDRLDEVG